MKTYIISLPERLKMFNKKLDVKGALCGKSWVVFNDDGVKQLFIFNTDGSLLITLNGIVIHSTWKFIPANSSIIITSNNETIMFLPAFYDEVIFALQQDGVEKYLFMIDEKKSDYFSEITLKELMSYMEDKEKMYIDAQKQDEKLTDHSFVDIEVIREDEKKAMRQFIMNQDWMINFKRVRKNALIGLAVSITCLITSIIIGYFLEPGVFLLTFIFIIISLICISYLTDSFEEFIRKQYEEKNGVQLTYLDNKDIKLLLSSTYSR